MSTSLADQKNYSPADVVSLASLLMKRPVERCVPIGHGANSQVYRLSTADGDYVMKFYFRHPHDRRDRMGTEFTSLSFLWDQGVRQIPQPLSIWPQHACALYTMIEGEHLQKGKAADRDLQEAVNFLKTLKKLNQAAAGKGFNPASEAFFSPQEMLGCLKTRLVRLRLTDSGPEYQRLRCYLQDEFIPLLETVAAWSRDCLSAQNILWERQLPKEYRTLSPSDFSFHNALRVSSGHIVFLDFEYFGWDDPVKTVSDFLWHPAMELTEKSKVSFVECIENIFSDDPDFSTRLKALFPVFGLKWCLILLNEFVDSDMQRRAFAKKTMEDKTAIRFKQLDKARALSDQIRHSYRDFPYGN